MPKFSVESINVPVEKWEVQTKYFIELDREEAKLLMAICGKIAGPPGTDLRMKLADPIYDKFRHDLKLENPVKSASGMLYAEE